jgi:hypothetical protein
VYRINRCAKAVFCSVKFAFFSIFLRWCATGNAPNPRVFCSKRVRERGFQGCFWQNLWRGAKNKKKRVTLWGVRGTDTAGSETGA